MVFCGPGKLSPEKTSQSKMITNNKLNPSMTPGWNRNRATLEEGERSHHCVNRACARPWFTSADMTRNKVFYLCDNVDAIFWLLTQFQPTNYVIAWAPGYRDCAAVG